MAGLGIDLATGYDQEIVLAGEVPNLLVGPENIVIGEAYTVQSQRLGALDQFVYAHETVVGVGVAVSMKIYQQELSIQPGFSTWARGICQS